MSKVVDGVTTVLERQVTSRSGNKNLCANTANISVPNLHSANNMKSI